MVLRLSQPDPALQASYLSALAELQAEGNGHYFDMVHAPEPGYAGRELHARHPDRPRDVRGVLRPHHRLRAPADAPARRGG